jgi:UDP-glucose:(heptosyl)LPS alpha-1,3-glucosyltransferase
MGMVIMRIGLVLEQFDPLRGGLEQWTWQFVQWLVDRGHEVHVAAMRFAEPVLQAEFVAHHVMGVRSRLEFAASAERILRPLALDVVHDTGAGWYCNVFQPHGGSWLALLERRLLSMPPKVRNAKRVLTHIAPRYRRFRSLCRRQYVDDGRVFLALSDMVARDFEGLHGIPRQRIRVVYNGVDVQRFTPQHRVTHRAAMRRELGVTDNTVLLLIVAHNFRLKGVYELLEAVKRLVARRQPVHLTVVGGKRLRAARWAARRLGIESQVRFAGRVTDVVPFYAAADIYVQPTRYDPCSLVVLEALACGLPVVTSQHNGMSERITDGIEGSVVHDPTNVAELTSRLEPLMDPDVRRRMSEAARCRALELPFESNCTAIESIYKEIGARRRAA